MIVYTATKQQFVEDVVDNCIHEKILREIKLKGIGGGSHAEIASWRNSMQFMRTVVDVPELPNDAKVSLEYSIPLTNKRVDFILTGKDENQKDNAVIIELKQWSEVAITGKDGLVSTFVGKAVRETIHPSYQAWCYASLVDDYNETVRKESIVLTPCAYLHNLDSNEVINDPFYEEHIQKAPIFISKDVKKLREFLGRFVKFGDHDDIMYRIDHGKIKPSKNLADSLAGMLKGNPEFLMIDDQKVVFETALDLDSRTDDAKKQVLIVEGGPGTGKSVVAINLLVELTKKERVAQYVTKNMAPREVYSARLSGTMRKNQITNLFKGSASYTDSEPHFFDALIVDEAHRLMEKNRYHKLSENQIKELIRASKLSVFFIDEDQVVTWSDIGSKAEIKKFAHMLGAEVHEQKLESQFRCNGSDGYLAWVDHVLQIHETANPTLDSSDYEFVVHDDPNSLRESIFERNMESNRARMVAGYCWDWLSKKDQNAMDIVIPEYGFEARWNLTKDGSLWIIAEESVKELGCIHTCQGLELDHIGVIIGPDLVVRDGQVVTDATRRSNMDSSIKGYKKLFRDNPVAAKEKADRIVKNTYRTLMTRGQKSCLVFSVDPETNEYFRGNAREC